MSPEPPDWLEDCLRSIGSFQADTQDQINPSSPDTKGRIDLVTEVDHKSEEQLVERILKNHPDDGILAEEDFSREGSNEREWIIDPLDGTTNYVQQHPFYGISVALVERDELVLGATYFPEFNDLYFARADEGASKNGQPIQVSSTSDPIQSFLATGFADLRKENEDERYNLDAFRKIIQKVRGIRRGGSAVHDLCLTAEGVFDGFWEFNLQPWDVAAGALLIREARGTVTDMNGGEGWLDEENIVASNQVFHETLLEWLKPFSPDNTGTER